MGVIEEERTGQRVVLATRTLIGRSSACFWRLRQGYASNEHALMWFKEGAWWLRDLSSRNGTWVDREKVEALAHTPLKQGSRIAFGKESEAWTLVNADPPGPMAEALEGGALIGGDPSMLMLPSEEEPEAAIFDDGRGGWVLELDGETQSLTDRQLLSIAGTQYRILLPSEAPLTWEQAAASEGPLLRLRVSGDQEYIEVEVEVGGETTALKPRAHHVLLLTLAQIREQQEEDDVAEVERGWVYTDELMKMLRLDRRTINQYVFRTRRELTPFGEGLAAKAVERRSVTDQIRLGLARVEITELGA